MLVVLVSCGVLVGGEDHRAPFDMPFVDDVEQHVRGVVAVGEVADLVDDQHVRPHVARHGFAQLQQKLGAQRGEPRGIAGPQRLALGHTANRLQRNGFS